MTTLTHFLSTLLNSDYDIYEIEDFREDCPYIFKIPLNDDKSFFIVEQINEFVTIGFGIDNNILHKQIIPISYLKPFLIKYAENVENVFNMNYCDNIHYSNSYNQIKLILKSSLESVLQNFDFNIINTSPSPLITFTNKNKNFHLLDNGFFIYNLSFKETIENELYFINIKSSVFIKDEKNEYQNISISFCISPLEFNNYPILQKYIKIMNNTKPFDDNQFLSNLNNYIKDPTLNHLLLSLKLQDSIPENKNTENKNKI